ncbi:MAG: hypothetical protein AMXMBFR72_28670 [Betaproteobacteria bacterium]
MRWFVVVPGALVPASLAADVLAGTAAPRLAQRLARAARGEGTTGDETTRLPHLEWLWRAFDGPTHTPVTAPYAWRALNGDSATNARPESQLWFCEPVHFAFARDHLLVTPLAEAPLDAAEARALAGTADEAARESGAALRLIDHGHWFLHVDAPWHLDTVPLAAALGRSAEDVLPTGADAARWRKLLNEIQMRWHIHPVNAARDARGAPTVNALWLHGGGVWNPLPHPPFATLLSDDPVLRGWALAAGLAPSALLPADATPNAKGDALSVWDGLQSSAIAEDWGAWLGLLPKFERMLESLCERAFGAGFASVDLVLAGGRGTRRFTLGTRDGWRFWRRAKLSELLREADTE